MGFPVSDGFGAVVVEGGLRALAKWAKYEEGVLEDAIEDETTVSVLLRSLPLCRDLRLGMNRSRRAGDHTLDGRLYKDPHEE